MVDLNLFLMHTSHKHHHNHHRPVLFTMARLVFLCVVGTALLLQAGTLSLAGDIPEGDTCRFDRRPSSLGHGRQVRRV
jgi:hypothetical protein